jgi:hypothetical protein
VELYAQLVWVVLVLALAAGFAWWVRGGAASLVTRKWAANGGGKRIRVLQRAPLTPQHCMHAVSVDGREWIIATHPNGVTVLETGDKGLAGKEVKTC